MPLRRTIWLAAGLAWRSGRPRPEEGGKGRGGGARGRVKQQEVKVEAVAMVLAPADPKEEARDLPPWSDFSLLPQVLVGRRIWRNSGSSAGGGGWSGWGGRSEQDGNGWLSACPVHGGVLRDSCSR
jgi:hypothetical protein